MAPMSISNKKNNIIKGVESVVGGVEVVGFDTAVTWIDFPADDRETV